MGSKSDLPVMQDAIDILKDFDIEIEVNIVSAHRTPEMHTKMVLQSLLQELVVLRIYQE